MYLRELRSEHSQQADHVESHPTWIRSLGQHRHHPDHYDNLDKEDEMPFSDYIMMSNSPENLSLQLT